MAEMMSLLRGSNRAASSSTPPPAYGSTIDPASWVSLTQMQESTTVTAPMPMIQPVPIPPPMHVSTVQPVSDPLPPPPAPTDVPLPPAAFLMSDPAIATVIVTVNVDPAFGLHSPSTKDLPGVECLHSCSTYRALYLLNFTTKYEPSIPSPITPNMPFPQSGTITHVAPTAPPTNFLPEGETEQEWRLKKIEEIVKAIQAGDYRHSTSYLDLNLVPSMPLPPKIKVPDFQKYDGISDPLHHLRHYRGKMFSTGNMSSSSLPLSKKVYLDQP
ncbi:mucin-2-like [Punica granatum]|uniref:Mucin-2-like n=1 Tax=Punica granatum TaxID=22663 RepID=A0A6P8DCQ9_PUNGR|nr:mucin-2-like [Punica granatum]